METILKICFGMENHQIEKKIKTVTLMMMLLVLTACVGKETQSNLNLEHDGVITQQIVVDSTFPNIEDRFKINKIDT